MSMLAIIVPYYKIDFFEETLHSVAAQTDKRFTLYIGNDASPNNPKSLIEKYFPEGNYHYFDYKENVGGKNLALQWERIIENITEEWFQILGDDDVLANNFVEEIYKALPEVNARGTHLIKTGMVWINEEGINIENNINDFGQVSAQEIFIKKYHGKIRSSLSENIYHTATVKQIKFNKLPLAWGTDDLSLLDFTSNGEIHYISKHLVNVRISKSSITGSPLLEAEKLYAIHLLRKTIILQYHNKLPYKFITTVIDDYLSASYNKALPISRKTLCIHFKKLNFKRFLIDLKKTYYIYRKHKL